MTRKHEAFSAVNRALEFLSDLDSALGEVRNEKTRKAVDRLFDAGIAPAFTGRNQLTHDDEHLVEHPAGIFQGRGPRCSHCPGFHQEDRTCDAEGMDIEGVRAGFAWAPPRDDGLPWEAFMEPNSFVAYMRNERKDIMRRYSPKSPEVRALLARHAIAWKWNREAMELHLDLGIPIMVQFDGEDGRPMVNNPEFTEEPTPEDWAT